MVQKEEVDLRPAPAGSAPTFRAAPPEEARRPARSWRLLRGRWGLALALTAGFLVLIPLDFYAVDFQELVERRHWLDDLFNPLRDFGGTAGQAILLAMLFAADPPRRRWVLVGALGIALCSLTVNTIKVFVARARPEALLGIAHFRPWGGIFDDSHSSFPSGHSASAFAVAVILAHVYPRARWGFYLLAAGCGLARVAEARHFPTDVYAGALLGLAVGRWLIGRAVKRCASPPSGS